MDKDNNINDNKKITDVGPQNELDNIFTELTKDKKDSKQSTFYLYWLFGFPIKTCADKAGYAESYGYKLVEKYKKVPKLRHRVDEILNMFPERYKSFCRLRLPQIAEIEGKALQKPQLAIDNPQLLKQIKQGGGVDLNETAPTPKAQTINVTFIRSMFDSINPYTKDKPKVINAEVIDTEK